MAERRSGYEKSIPKETTYQRELSPSQFTEILRSLPIPSQRARVELTPQEKASKDVQAFIEWHHESGYTLTELRKYPKDKPSFPLILPRDRRNAQREIIKEGSHPITIDIYEKKLKPGQGFKQFQETKLSTLTDAGYIPEAATIFLRDRGLLGSLDSAALKYKEGQLSLTMDTFLGSKRFTEHVTNWWNQISPNPTTK